MLLPKRPQSHYHPARELSEPTAPHTALTTGRATSVHPPQRHSHTHTHTQTHRHTERRCQPSIYIFPLKPSYPSCLSSISGNLKQSFGTSDRSSGEGYCREGHFSVCVCVCVCGSLAYAAVTRIIMLTDPRLLP